MNQPTGNKSKGIIIGIALMGVLITGGFTSMSLKNDSSLFKVSKTEPIFNSNLNSAFVDDRFGEEYSVACYSKILLSVVENCRVEVMPSHIGVGLNGGNYEVRLETKDGKVLPGSPVISGEFAGMEIKAILTNLDNGHTCWGYVVAEDKDPPVIDCEDREVSCIEAADLGLPDVVDNCDPNPDLFLVEVIKEALPCHELYTHRIIRRFVAVDRSGNESEVCEQITNVLRINVDHIDFPENRTSHDNSALECNNYETDEAGFPHPDVTGVPTLEGTPLYPYFDNLCNVLVIYKDHEITDPKGCHTKILRTWKVLEWYCTQGRFREEIQIIEVKDTTPPEIINPLPDDMISTIAHACEGYYILPSIEAVDDCNPDDIRVDIIYPGGFIQDKNGGVGIYLPLGDNEIIYYVYDWCGNVASDTFHVEVKDLTPPVAVCLLKSVVSLGDSGYVKVPALVFDNGSFDECELDYFEARRKDDGTTCVSENKFDGSVFNEFVEFCCADAGNIVIVEVRVWDKAGNSNLCWVEVKVQEISLPEIVPPVDTVMYCHEPYDLEDLSRFGTPEVVGICGAEWEESAIDYIDQCGFGYIIRTFTAKNSKGEATAQQKIDVINPNPFEMDPDNWPLDFEAHDLCGFEDVEPGQLPEGFGFPIIEFGPCDLVGMTYHDERFYSSGTDRSCFKILRKWTVIDWCQLDRGGEARRWHHYQVIKISNNIAPEITGSLETVEICATTCEEGRVTLEQSATDDCTPLNELRWNLFIDLFKDGNTDIEYSGTGNEASVTDDFPVGEHLLTWLFYDRCGNSIKAEQTLIINPCIGPKGILINRIAIALSPMDLSGDGNIDTEMACLWAHEFDVKSYHPCDIDFEFSFSPDSIVTELCFDCFSLGLNVIPIYIIDIFGNIEVIYVEVDVQDNNDVDFCEDPCDCVMFPPNIVVSDCVDDYSPDNLGSMPIVDPDCICMDFDISFVDEMLAVYPNPMCTFIRRTWTVQFNCGPNPIICTSMQNINVFNLLPPSLTIPDDITLMTSDETCEAEATDLSLASSISTCNTGVVITNSYNGNGPDANDIYPIGITEVIFTATDDCGNQAFDTLRVTVLDGTPPVCIPQDITVTLDEMGMVVVEAAEVDGGSFDRCGIIDSLDISKSKFDCDDIGDNLVTLTVFDDSGNSSSCEAIITVVDTIAPICVVRDITINVDTSGITVITPEMINNGSFDPCGFIVDFSLDRDTFDCTDSGNTIEVILTLTDNSGNTTDCEAMVTVVDNIAPICEVMDITITIAENNEVIISPLDIDAGSFDPCGFIVDSTLSKTLFTCDDLGENTVIYTVTDNSGNMSTCEVSVYVEDGTMLMCVPMDITIYLDEDGMASITAADVDGGSAGGCFNDITLSIDRDTFDCDDVGSPVVVILTVTDSNASQSTCEANVTVLDSFPPMIECENITLSCLDFDGNFDDLLGYTVTDNCGMGAGMIAITVLVDATNDCGIGILTRRITVTDAFGNSDFCDQIITIEGPPNPFGESNITPPTPQIILTNCQTPGNLGNIGGAPVVDVSSVDCADVEVTFTDQLLTAGNGCNDTIRRTYTIVDLCQFDGVSMAGMWVYIQEIIIQDLIPPVVTAPADVTVQGVFNSTICDFEFTIPQFSASDNCTPLGQLVFTNDSPHANNNNSIDISGDYPPGVYNITVTATDLCGNVGMASFMLTIEDPGEFGLPCAKIFTTINDNLMAVVNVNDYIDFTQDDCYEFGGLVFSWSRTSQNVPNITFDCDDVGITNDPAGLGIITPIYAWMGGMVVDSCVDVIRVTDPSDFCPDGLVMGGVVTNVLGENVEGVKVIISGDVETERMTNSSGFFMIDDLDLGSSVTIHPYKNDDVLNGVSTLDLVRIQRHILGEELFTSSYELIAADVDNNKVVSSSDLIALRRVLLGIQPEFPNNTSWRMIENSYRFSSFEETFADQWPETYTVDHFDRPMTIMFTGVKIGDVDHSAKVNSRQINTRSRREAIVFEMRAEGGKFLVSSTQDCKLAGFQMSLSNMSGMSGLESSLSGFTSSHFRIDPIGNMHISWNTTNDYVYVKKGDVLFSWEGATGAMDIRQDGRLYPEIYLIQNDEIKSFDLKLERIGTDNDFFISSASPNPWAVHTDIAFYMSYEDRVTINFYDSGGRFLHQKIVDSVSGRNELRVERSELPASGLIIYEIASSKEVQKGKMILLR